MADNNKVTIDAAWFADLYAASCEYNTALAVRDAAIKERDELKATIASHWNYEAVIAAKDREIEAVKEERNRLNAKVNELMKQKEAVERCIEEIWSKMQTFDIPDRQRLIELESIIRAYREKKEAK